MSRSLIRFAALPLLLLGACSQSYSPDTYATRAVQQANKAERGVVIGVRKVDIRADGTTGAAAGAAAGGAAGSQVGQGGLSAAFGAIGGGVLGGLVGSAAERSAGDTDAFEYIVRKPNNELVSVVQKDDKALAIGQRVLVISGNQARIVPDYTTDPPEDPKTAASHSVTPAPAARPAEGAAPAEGGGPGGTAAPASASPVGTDLPAPVSPATPPAPESAPESAPRPAPESAPGSTPPAPAPATSPDAATQPSSAAQPASAAPAELKI